MSHWRQGEFGKRPVRIANCSGYCGNSSPAPSFITLTNLIPFLGDPPVEMYKQATLGDVDFITGDYLAGKLDWSLKQLAFIHYSDVLQRSILPRMQRTSPEVITLVMKPLPWRALR